MSNCMYIGTHVYIRISVTPMGGGTGVAILDNCGFLRHPWDGEGRGEGSGKWMVATLDFAVPRWGLFSIIVDF